MPAHGWFTTRDWWMILGLYVALILTLAVEVLGGLTGGLFLRDPRFRYAFVGLIAISLPLLLVLRRRRGSAWVSIQPRALRTQAERDRYAQRGVIAFVSVYRPNDWPRVAPPAGSAPEDWVCAAREGRYEALAIPNSNLQATALAVLSHARNLEYCWLIATGGDAGSPEGSAPFAHALKDYLEAELQARGNTTCTIFSGPEYSISFDDDATLCQKAFDLVRRIYDHASSLGLSSREVVADFTSGPRGLALGMILACTDRDQDIQMVGVRYDKRGTAIAGTEVPLRIEFEAISRAET